MKIAIVNDTPLIVKGLRHIINSTGEHEVAWTAMSGDDAIEKCRRILPDLILMDLMMAGLNGVEATRYIMKNTPCPIIVITDSLNENTGLVFDAMSAGALDVVVMPNSISSNSSKIAGDILKKISIIKKLTQEYKPVNSRLGSGIKEKKDSASNAHLVAIGCSSGGPEALATLFSNLPAGLGKAAFVVIQHVDKQFAASMAAWLDARTALSVELAKAGDQLQAGKVLIAATNNHMIINEKEQIAYTREPENTFCRPSVDVFFYSMLKNWKGSATAILLTGMGSDGADGLLSLKQSGVYTLAQDSETSAVYGMPKAAKELDAACDIMSIGNIASYIQDKFATQNYKNSLD